MITKLPSPVKKFQHTLQPEGWSDDEGFKRAASIRSFNTRSSRRAGATAGTAFCGGLYGPFQHTLQPEGWSDPLLP